MKPETRKRILWILVAVVVLALVIYGFWPRPQQVQTATVTRNRLEVLIEEEGRTYVRQDFVISAPTAGYMRRIELEVGDRIEEGQALAQIEAPRPTDLDPRAREEAETRVNVARANVTQAEEQARSTQVAADLALEERDRLVRLVEAGATTAQARDRAEAEASQAAAALDAARAQVDAARAQLATAEAALQPVRDDTPVQQVISSPASGQVLAVHRRSASHVNPGEPLMELGNVEQLEVRINVLSQDAVRIRPNTQVRLAQWGQNDSLEAVVRLVDPQGFTQVSALGVEEQRVRVVADLVSPPEQWENLGSGYRVLAQFVVWEGDDVLQVPMGALFRAESGWAAFVLENGRAARRAVTIGEQTGLAAQVISGLKRDEVVIIHPDDRITHGTRVRSRTSYSKNETP